MILRPFLSNQPFVLALLLPVLAMFCILNGVFDFHQLFAQVDMGMWGKTNLLNVSWISFVSAFIVGLNAVQINFLFNTHEFMDRNNYAPSLFYVVLMSFSHSFYQPDGILFAHVCWIQVVRLLFTLRPNEDVKRNLFNAAFFTGLSATFHPASAGMLVFFWLAVTALRPMSFREFIISIIGFLMPIASALVYWWYSGHNMDLSLLRNTAFISQETFVYYTTSGLMTGLFLLSIIGIQIRLQKSSIRFKKLTRSLMFVLAGSVLMGIAQLIFYRQIEWFSSMFIVLSFFFTFAFIHKFWKAIATFFFYMAFVLAVIKFFPYAHFLVA